MQAIELETNIDKEGKVQLPERYHHIYGRKARLVILLPDFKPDDARQINPMDYSNTVDWPIDGMAYQTKARGEWE
ncbi:MAG: hypothetical protein HY801_05405 [Candidatus Lindowbacteria bacterium]|nr:hypothetical protein [Candidatus Lindowbacteria bacterium]